MSRRNEIPATPGFAKVEMRSQDALAAIQAPLRVFDMDMVDTIGELLDKCGRVEKLMEEMAWVKVNTKAAAVADGIKRFSCRHKIVGNFGGMYFQTKLHAFPFKYIDNWIPASRKILVPFLDFRKVIRRKGVEQVPDARSSEPIDLGHAEFCSCACCVLEFLCSTLAHALRLAITPNMGRKNSFVA